MINRQNVDNLMCNKNPVLMKSKHRVQKHGEVFTPQWVIDKMISIPGIKEKTEDVFATFLEPSAGKDMGLVVDYIGIKQDMLEAKEIWKSTGKSD